MSQLDPARRASRFDSSRRPALANRVIRSLAFGLLMAAGPIGCDEEASPACTPGETRLCAGAGRCSGSQSCLADGTGFEPTCDCSIPPPEDFGQPDDPEATQSIVGRACTEDSQCGEGLTCLTSDEDSAFFGGGPAHGYCTASCTLPEECTSVDPVSECVITGEGGSGYCLRTCASRTPPATENKCLNRSDLVCRSVAALRLEEPGFGRQRGWCYPQCNSDADCSGRRCDLATGACVDAAPTGKAIGERCVEPSECGYGICLGLSATTPDERLCSAPCRYAEPASAAGCGYGLNASSREAGCLGPQIVSFLGEEGTGDLGYCLELCDVDADCAQNEEFGWVCSIAPGFSPRTGRAGLCLPPEPLVDGGLVDSGAGDSGTASASQPDSSVAVDASGG